MPKSFAQQIRDIMRIDLKDREKFTYQDIALRLDLVYDADKRPLYRSIRDFVRRGEVIRVGTGVLSYRGRTAAAGKEMSKTECMWRLIRANRSGTVSANDLMANCGATKTFAQEYLRMLVRRGIMRGIKTPGNQPYVYKLVDDPGPNLVKNEDNAEKLRRLRETARLAGDALAAIQESLDVAVAAVALIREEKS